MEKHGLSNGFGNSTYLSEDKTSVPKETVNTNSINSGVEVSEGTIEAAAEPNPYGGTKRGLRSRHAQMIALGGAIGSG